MKARFKKHILNFNTPGGTSRGVLHQKTSYFLEIKDDEKVGIGEVSILPKLSIDENEEVLERKLSDLCAKISNHQKIEESYFENFPALKFGYETAIRDLNSQYKKEIFNSDFAKGKKGIPINGLIWMGSKDFMLKQIEDKLAQGFRCLKLKIGAIDFETELDILNSIRKRFSPESLELRVDANGAFSKDEALKKLNDLSQFKIHSIEQPIKPKQWNAMAMLTKKTPIPIALDEELIGVKASEINTLLDEIQPQYIILKPSLIGGFAISDQWIASAEKIGIGWWLTSALEANIGLNAIAQYAATKNSNMPQGLGTGQVFRNNINSPLQVIGDELWYITERNWEELF